MLLYLSPRLLYFSLAAPTSMNYAVLFPHYYAALFKLVTPISTNYAALFKLVATTAYIKTIGEVLKVELISITSD